MAKKSAGCMEIRTPPTKMFNVGMLLLAHTEIQVIVVAAHRLSVVDGVLYFELDSNGDTDDVAVFKDWLYVVLTEEKVLLTKEKCKLTEDFKPPEKWGNVD